MDHNLELAVTVQIERADNLVRVRRVEARVGGLSLYPGKPSDGIRPRLAGSSLCQR